MNKIETLSEKARDCAEKMLAMLDGTGFKYKILETYRTKETQVAYYAQGRKSISIVNELRAIAGMGPISESENKYTITKCDGINTRSNHQSGNAIDIVPIVDGKIPWSDTSISESRASKAWKQLGEIGKQAGFSWGGDWGKTSSKYGWDCPHFEVKE